MDSRFQEQHVPKVSLATISPVKLPDYLPPLLLLLLLLLLFLQRSSLCLLDKRRAAA